MIGTDKERKSKNSVVLAQVVDDDDDDDDADKDVIH